MRSMAPRLSANVRQQRKGRMWSDITFLRSLSTWLQWGAIGLVFLGGFLQIGRYLVDRRERALSAVALAEESKPTRRPITTGTATIELFVESDQEFNNHFLDRGAFLGIGKGSQPLMILRSIDCFAKQL